MRHERIAWIAAISFSDQAEALARRPADYTRDFALL